MPSSSPDSPCTRFDDADFRECVRLFKQRTSFEWKRHSGTELSQRSYFDRVLRADEDTCSVAHYILANPVRAGLVKDPWSIRS